MKRSRSCALAAAVFAACLSMISRELAFAQERPEAGKVDDASLRLQLSVTRTEFRCGEVIPLDLTFTSTTPERYQINMATYDRSGRMSYEQFLLDPQNGTSDPLQLYFNSAWGFLGGGLTGFKFLSPSPTTIQLDLNEWARFDQPGTYRLTVVSQRVNDTRASDNPYGGTIELKSNPIELRIIATPHGNRCNSSR